MLSAFRFYELYSALNLHFQNNSNYDFFKYNGKTRVSEKSFLTFKGRYFCEKFAKKFHKEDAAISFIVANFFYNHKWINEFEYDVYLKFNSYKEAIQYKFVQDLERFWQNEKENPLDILFSDSNDSLLYLILSDIILDGKLFNHLDKKFETDDILWNEYKQKLLKYYPFILTYWLDENGQIKQQLLAAYKAFKQSKD